MIQIPYFLPTKFVEKYVTVNKAFECMIINKFNDLISLEGGESSWEKGIWVGFFTIQSGEWRWRGEEGIEVKAASLLLGPFLTSAIIVLLSIYSFQGKKFVKTPLILSYLQPNLYPFSNTKITMHSLKCHLYTIFVKDKMKILYYFLKYKPCIICVVIRNYKHIFIFTPYYHDIIYLHLKWITLFFCFRVLFKPTIYVLIREMANIRKIKFCIWNYAHWISFAKRPFNLFLYHFSRFSTQFILLFYCYYCYPSIINFHMKFLKRACGLVVASDNTIPDTVLFFWSHIMVALHDQTHN